MKQLSIFEDDIILNSLKETNDEIKKSDKNDIKEIKKKLLKYL